MLKVLCIDNSPREDFDFEMRLNISRLKEGVEYDVVQSDYFDESYIVKGLEKSCVWKLFKKRKHLHFRKSRFVSISNIDESQFDRFIKSKNKTIQ